MNLLFKVHQTIEIIFDYLTDMQKFVSVHPVISKIDKLSEKNYLVHETLKFGLIPFSFTYPVTIEQDFDQKQVSIKATVMKIAKIEMSFKLHKEDDFTIVDESILFKSPLPVKFIMKNIFRKQHNKLFKNIEIKR